MRYRSTDNDGECCVRCGAFTLIELLVVVSIIVLLVAMLMPVLGNARNTARKIACAAKLQQIGNAFGDYMADHQGRFLRYPTITNSAMVYGGRAGDWTSAYNSATGHGPSDRLLNRYVGVPQNLTPADDATYEVKLFECPSDSGALGGNPAWDHTYTDVGTSYAYNYWASIGGAPTLRDKGIGSAKQPDFTILAGGHPIHNFFNGTDRQQRWHDPDQPTANIVFLDFHVEYGLVEPTNTTDWYSYLLDPNVP